MSQLKYGVLITLLLNCIFNSMLFIILSLIIETQPMFILAYISLIYAFLTIIFGIWVIVGLNKNLE